ncbi:MAG: ABC transporter permease [Clostridia bacterium]|nr:ABC transporter permease [Clostridia bacterium]
MDSEAMRNWEEYTGINASNEYRSELLVLWGEEYDPVIAAASVDEIEEMLGITIEDENIKNGKTFFTSQNGFNFLVDDLKTFERIGRALTIDPNGKMSYTQVNSNSKIDPIELDVNLTDYTSVSEVANTVNFPLGTDNNGRDMLLLLITAAGKSLLIGLLAGSIATFLGLLVGLLAGYVGGKLDDILSFIMNIFTVIPGFVLIIIIYNMVDKSQRGIVMCGAIIGVTSWVWTARSVRSQVISLRNRDHVNLSKLSGHSLMRIILTDILPYIASYVVMAFILQVSSGILAEAQLSILGLGPSMNDGSTLGLMMNWAKLFGAYTSSNAWWAYFPVIGTIALISFSLNLMNTGLDQVFNPTLRD